MSDSQRAASAKYRAKQIQVQALINPDTEKDLAAAWEYLKRQFGGSGKKALAWAVSHAKNSMDLFYVWRDGEEDSGLRIKAVTMAGALDEAAFQLGFIDYADMAQEHDWENGEGLNVKKINT
ncbi:hypothetical protein [Pseudomonas putida]|uniref:Uncharacterized protein n=1 Tax=Pseudomonas putida TaxID=303 RepID=A0A1Q9R3D4_PSEPU|nr:hypothetical protein [Pseudomonas putida]OLS61909.1 hypothetical protein PSEMO_32820 [Pseudomonas putida]